MIDLAYVAGRQAPRPADARLHGAVGREVPRLPGGTREPESARSSRRWPASTSSPAPACSTSRSASRSRSSSSTTTPAAWRCGSSAASSAAKDGAAGLIRQVVESAEFLSHPHTRKHWREELTVPSPLVARDTYGDWEARGAPWADEVAAKEVERRLAKCPPRPPADDVIRALDEIMQREARAAGLSELPAID